MNGHSKVLAVLGVVVAWPLRLVSHLGALVAKVARAVQLAVLLAMVLAAACTVAGPWGAARDGRLLAGALVLACLLWQAALSVLAVTQDPAAVFVRLPV